MILYSPINPTAFSILNLEVRWYGIIMAFAIFIGFALSSFLCLRKYSTRDCDIFLDMAPYTVIFAIIGARIFYVVGDWQFYSNNLSEIFMLNHGGISIYGALIFGVITLFLYCRVKKLKMYKFSDIIAISMPLCQSIGRWGNFINQEAYGVPYNGLLKLYIDDAHRYPQFINIEYYHPAFLYESLLDLLLFFILLFAYFKYKNLKDGTLTFIYLILYATVRLIVEHIRIDSILNISGIHIASIISVLIITTSIVFLFIINKRTN